jgi:hypothetical protein
MSESKIEIWFEKRAKIALADNEKVSIWETGSGSFDLSESRLILSGYWRVSMIGNFLGAGLLGLILIRPFFMRERRESIPVKVIQRIVLHRKGKQYTFHIFQPRADGLVEVHIFTTSAPMAVNEAFRSRAPSLPLTEEGS